MREEYPTTKQLRRIAKQAFDKHNVIVDFSRTRAVHFASLPWDQWNEYRNTRVLRMVQYHLKISNIEAYVQSMRQVKSWLLLSNKTFRLAEGCTEPKYIGEKTIKIICTI